MTQMVEHHTHYKEIHGYDKTVMMTNADHQALHRRLRKDGNCNIPVDELTNISNSAHSRTDKRIDYNKKYRLNHRNNISFVNTLMPNVYFRENIEYNNQSGCVSVVCGFYANHGKSSIHIDVS